ncbi:MAG: glycosyltransferase [Acidobacteria bacterium]|nr:glycosyltransferase [Acidobacteriota bacterium]
MISSALPAFLFAASSSDQLVNLLFDDTFAGIHQLSWFDWALMGPYFFTLTILAIYGCHRYHVIHGYFKYKKNIPTESATQYTQLPKVTIQLPLYNERYVVERLIEETVKMRYPRELFQIQVLDDSTDETHPFTEALVARYQAMGHPIEYVHRTNRHGYKAGALQEGLRTATGEIVAVFDADFLPPVDFLEKTIHHFSDPQVGVVQTRWTYLNRDYNLLTEVQTILLDGHFALEHVARAGSGLYFNFNGTAGLLRVSMIEDAGGWQHDTLTEDSDLSYRAQLKGWKFVYRPDVECLSELPVDTYGFQVQQSRWAKGLTQVAIKLLRDILKSDAPLRNKVEAVFHLTPNISYPMMLIVSALMLPVMICRFYMGWMQMLYIDLPLIVASFWSISAFYLTAQRVLYPNNWKRTVFFLPALMAAGVALTLSNTKAFFEAVFGVSTAFARTPKYAISGSQKVAVKAAYKSRSGILPYLELAAGTYFVFMTGFAIDTYNFLAVPFLLIFVTGYYWAGVTTLIEEYKGKMAWQRQRALALETAGRE